MQFTKKLCISLLVIVLLLISGNPTLADDCEEAGAWYDEGLLLSNNSDQEASYYQRAIHLCPEFVAAYNRLGELYKNQGKYILSIEAFEQARIRALSSNRFASLSGSKALFLESIISLGEIYRLEGKYEQAAEEFSKALRIDPDALAAQNNLQYVYKRMHSYDTVQPPNNSLMETAIFTRISGMTRPINTFKIDFQYKLWHQESIITQDMIEGEEVTVLPPNESTVITDEELRALFFPSPTEMFTSISIFSIRYGLTNNLAIGLIPKYFYRSIDASPAGFTNLSLPSLKDIGDAEFLVKYRLWGKGNKHFSLYTLFNIPLGQEHELVGEEPLTSTLVTMDDGSTVQEDLYFKRYIPFGSESWDITPGIAFTLGLDPLTLQSNLQYRFTDGELVGDELLFNVATIYRMNRSVNAILEVNYRWQGEARRLLHTILYKYRPDTTGGPEQIPGGPITIETHYTTPGGDILYISPGLQVSVSKRVKLEFGAQIPISQTRPNITEDTVYLLALSFLSF